MKKRDLIERIRDKTTKILEEDFKVNNSNFDALSISNLLEELNSYHIELSLQNDELLLANKKLEHTSKLFNAMFYEAPLGYILLDNKYKIIDLNIEALKILNLRKEDFTKLRLITYIGKGEISKFLDWSLDKTKSSLEIKFKVAGKTKWLNLNKAFWQDDTEYIFLTIKDITLEKKSEELKKKENQILSLTNILANLTEYWYRPLSNISMDINMMNEDLKKDKFSKLSLEQRVKKSAELINNLSSDLIHFKTLIDFDKSNFKKFSALLVLKESIHKFLQIESKYSMNIEIDKDLKDFEIFGNFNQFEEIVYKILKFMKDNVMFVDKLNIYLNTKIQKDKKVITIKVKGSIDEELIAQIYQNLIYDKYIKMQTTSEIFISKIILEYQLDGKLFIENSDEEIVIVIELPKEH